MAILELSDVSKAYPAGSEALTVVDQVSFHLDPGASCAVVGPSGSGKTTLLGLCAGLDLPTKGEIHLEGKPLHALSEDQRAALRRQRTGFIFQNFQLLPSLTALENVLVPLELLGHRGVRSQGLELLDKVGLRDRAHHYPLELSGGEQQRVAIARAFIHRPALLFADEPTGNLDAATSTIIEGMLFDLNQDAGTALLLVTHDPTLAGRAQRTLTMKGGRLASLTDNTQSATS